MHISTNINISQHVPLLQDFKRSVLTERSLLGRFFSHEVQAKYQWIQQVASQFHRKLWSAWAAYSSSWQRDFWITVIDFSLNGLENKIVLEDFTNLHNLKQLLLLLRFMSLISGEEKQPKWPWKTETSRKTNRGQPPAPGMMCRQWQRRQKTDLKAHHGGEKRVKKQSKFSLYYQ